MHFLRSDAGTLPVSIWGFGKSYKGHMVDALALIGDEGRGYLRKAPARR